VNIIFRRQLESSPNPEELRKKFIEEYRMKFANPWKAAELGYIDEVIFPEQTRWKIITALEMLKNKRLTNPPKKHGNIPL
jgi:propionyl-CoA carboxylase beta chain